MPYSETEAHFEEYHAKTPCPLCQQKFERSLLEDHQVGHLLCPILKITNYIINGFLKSDAQISKIACMKLSIFDFFFFFFFLHLLQSNMKHS